MFNRNITQTLYKINEQPKFSILLFVPSTLNSSKHLASTCHEIIIVESNYEICNKLNRTETSITAEAGTIYSRLYKLNCLLFL